MKLWHVKFKAMLPAGTADRISFAKMAYGNGCKPLEGPSTHPIMLSALVPYCPTLRADGNGRFAHMQEKSGCSSISYLVHSIVKVAQ